MYVLLALTAHQELFSLSTVSPASTVLERVVLWSYAREVIIVQADLILTSSVPSVLIVKMAVHNLPPVLTVHTAQVLWTILMRDQAARIAVEVCTQQRSSLTFALTALLATFAMVEPTVDYLQ